jgi:prepilin-type N-terminal cleavage/methylation domain-containing protein
MRRHADRSQQGITLIELLISMVVMGIITTMIIGSWTTLTDAFSFSSKSNKSREWARQAISRMSREIRDAQAPSGGTALKSTGFTEIQFYSTFNTTGAADPSSVPKLTRFILRSGVLYREKAGPDGYFGTADDTSTVLVRNVVNASIGRDLFIYYYYDSAGHIQPSSGATNTLPPNIAVVRAVGLNVVIDENPGKSPNYVGVNTTVTPRNLGQN